MCVMHVIPKVEMVDTFIVTYNFIKISNYLYCSITPCPVIKINYSSKNQGGLIESRSD